MIGLPRTKNKKLQRLSSAPRMGVAEQRSVLLSLWCAPIYNFQTTATAGETNWCFQLQNRKVGFWGHYGLQTASEETEVRPDLRSKIYGPNHLFVLAFGAFFWTFIEEEEEKGEDNLSQDCRLRCNLKLPQQRSPFCAQVSCGTCEKEDFETERFVAVALIFNLSAELQSSAGCIRVSRRPKIYFQR